jgi:predicted enzyme related to lactoylglutathione lyase
MIMSLNYHRSWLTIATLNVGQLVDFYSQFLQVKPQIYQVDVYAEFHLTTGLVLGIFKTRSRDINEFNQPEKSALSLCLQVENLEIAIAHLQTCGYEQKIEIITASHGQEIYIYDPDGNRIILYQITAD